MQSRLLMIEDDNLSKAWAKVMLRLLDKGVTELSPLTVTIHLPQGQPIESPSVRNLVDKMLAASGKRSCDTTANTIFPTSLWVQGADRQEFYARYLRLLPRLRKYSANRYGLYFERLIAHGQPPVNQLEHIIQTWHGGNHRRSALQAAIMDPAKDHTNQPVRGFPCLQQVAFAPSDGSLTITGFYGVQYIFDRAYGNYLGLCNLGQFMAHELGMPLTRLHCITSIAELGSPTKKMLEEMAQSLRDLVEQKDTIQAETFRDQAAVSSLIATTLSNGQASSAEGHAGPLESSTGDLINGTDRATVEGLSAKGGTAMLPQIAQLEEPVSTAPRKAIPHAPTR